MKTLFFIFLVISIVGCFSKDAVINVNKNTFSISKTTIPFTKVEVDSANCITIYANDSTMLTYNGPVIIK